MKTRNTNYKMDLKTNTIIMTKKFAEEASQYGSAAYITMMKLRKDGFHVTVRETPKRKACPNRMTFKQMKIHLSNLENSDERLAELQTVIDESKAHANHYEYVRKWFNENYPDFNAVPVVNKNYRIEAPRLKVIPAEEKEKKTA